MPLYDELEKTDAPYIGGYKSTSRFTGRANMTLIPCAICNNPCKDYSHVQLYAGSYCISCCFTCSNAVHYQSGSIYQSEDNNDPTLGEGFPNSVEWLKLIERCKRIYVGMQNAINKVDSYMIDSSYPSKKVYGEKCPCDMITSMCEYHR